MLPASTDQIRFLCLFRDVAEDHFAELAAGAVAKRVPPYESLIAEGDRPANLHVVLEGAVQLYSRRGRREASIGVVQPPVTFFLASTIYDLPCQASARTIEPSLILMIPAETVRAFFAKDAGFARAVVAQMSASFRRMTMELKAQRLCTSIERLANWILVQDKRHGSNGGFVLPYDKRTLAAHLGMTPENLSRNFALLSEHGIEVQRRNVMVADREKLAAFAEPAINIGDWDF